MGLRLIFSDKTLVQMAVSHPGCKEDLLELHGVGGSKLKKYGDDFFNTIRHFREVSSVG